MTIGAVLSEAWATYKAHWRHFVPLALAYFLVLSLVVLALALLFDWAGVIAGVFVDVVGTFWLQGALVTAVADVRDGRADLSIGETFTRARPYILTLLLAAILAGLGIAFGLLLLVVPGLVLLTWWSLIVPVIVLERAGVMQSFGRSRELVRGNGWNVFGVIVLTLVIAVVAGALVSAAVVWLPEELEQYVGNVVSSSLVIPFVATAWTAMYFRLAGERPETPAATAPIEPA